LGSVDILFADHYGRTIVTTWRDNLTDLPDRDATFRDAARASLDALAGPHLSASAQSGASPDVVSAGSVDTSNQQAAVTRAVLEALAAAQLSAEERIQSAVDEALAGS
jgi:hypothetical protein